MEIFEWERLSMGELAVEFLLEVVFRTTIMFLVLLITLRVAGKRGVRQLSVFETVIIIALGSAAGDPMFYEDVGIIPAVFVFTVVIMLYRFVTYLTGRFEWFEHFIEGKTVCLISEGKFSFIKFEKESLAHDEFFSELRVKSIEHLGQVRYAFLEPSGEISVFYYPDNEVKYGLPLLPEAFRLKSKVIPADGIYSCSRCGHTDHQKAGTATCPVCKKDQWVEAINSKRIA
jgi:uncharacterized membrane protein YcaP (DUF421 family)